MTGINRHVSDNRARRTGCRLCSQASRLPRPRSVTSQVGLPDVQPGDRPDDQHPLDFRRTLEDREDSGLRGSFRRSAACMTLRYQHGFSTGCPREMTVSVRPASVFKRGSGARREGTVNLSAASTLKVNCCADLPVSQPSPVRVAVRTGRTRAGRRGMRTLGPHPAKSVIAAPSRRCVSYSGYRRGSGSCAVIGGFPWPRTRCRLPPRSVMGPESLAIGRWLAPWFQGRVAPSAPRLSHSQALPQRF
jgi:hypothetical protein